MTLARNASGRSRCGTWVRRVWPRQARMAVRRSASLIAVRSRAATDAYEPLTKTVSVPTYGVIPVAVAHVCDLTWYCLLGNIHPKTAGYDLIGRLIVDADSKRDR